MKQIKRNSLIKDIRELVDIIDTTHPDPYLKCGGKIAFNKRMQELIRDLPEEGLSKEEFQERLQIFVAQMKDGHTTIDPPFELIDEKNPGGLPLSFDVVEGQLYINGVLDDKNKDLIGSKLMSVNGVSLTEILNRIEVYFPCENISHKLSYITNKKGLYYELYLQKLLPDWKPKSSLEIEVKRVNGEVECRILEPALNVDGDFIYLENATLEERSPFSYYFVDDSKKTAVLNILYSTNYFRENFENLKQTSNKDWWVRMLKSCYKHYHNKDPLESIEEMIASFPSATQMFTSLFTEMKDNQTKNLIINLSSNEGGTSTLMYIFLYFLAGLEKAGELLAKIKEIQLYSLRFEKFRKKKIDFSKIPYSDKVPLQISDYSFSVDHSFYGMDKLKIEYTESLENFMSKVPYIKEEMESREYENYYKPENLFILTGAATFSSGFDLTCALKQLGAKTVGTPPGQSINFFGNIIPFELKKSKISGSVATKLFVYDDSLPVENGTQLSIDHQLTYEKLGEFNFSKNHLRKYALEIINSDN